jgi:hypothetical protein
VASDRFLAFDRHVHAHAETYLDELKALVPDHIRAFGRFIDAFATAG